MRSEVVIERENLRLLKSSDAGTHRGSALSRSVEALKILTLALLREAEVLGQNSGPGNERVINLSDEVRRFESELIRSALVRTNGKQRRAARLLGMKVTTLHAKIKRYNIDSREIAENATTLRLMVK